MKQLLEEVRVDDNQIKRKVLEEQNHGFGYGGKYGVEKDRMDKVSLIQENFQRLECELLLCRILERRGQ